MLTAKELKAKIDTWVKSQVSTHEQASELYLLTLQHAMPRHLGGHGDCRLANRLIGETIGLRMDKLALSMLHFTKDYYPVFEVSIKDKEIKLHPKNKDFNLENAVKPYGKLSPVHYERVLTAEQEKQKTETKEKSASTRKANKAAADSAIARVPILERELAQSRETINKMRQEIDSSPDRIKAIELTNRVRELESILKEKSKDSFSVRAERDDWKRKFNGLNGLIESERTTNHSLRGMIAALESQLVKQA